MVFIETKLKGAYIIELNKIEDERGFFSRAFCKNEMEQYGLNTGIVQANLSHNKHKGTLRGMHLQLDPYREAKMVRCIRGSIYDAIVDLREDSATFKQWIGVELTDRNYRMLYVPEGFAHGFMTLEDDTDVMYQVTQFYSPVAERGYRWDDPAFSIQWPLQPTVVSARDQSHPFFESDLVKS